MLCACYVQINPGEVEALRSRLPCTFRQELTGVCGETLELLWLPGHREHIDSAGDSCGTWKRRQVSRQQGWRAFYKCGGSPQLMETLGSACPDKSTNSLQVLFHEGVLCLGGRGMKYALWQTWIKGLHRKIIRVYFKPRISPTSFFALS